MLHYERRQLLPPCNESIGFRCLTPVDIKILSPVLEHCTKQGSQIPELVHLHGQNRNTSPAAY